MLRCCSQVVLGAVPGEGCQGQLGQWCLGQVECHWFRPTTPFDPMRQQHVASACYLSADAAPAPRHCITLVPGVPKCCNALLTPRCRPRRRRWASAGRREWARAPRAKQVGQAGLCAGLLLHVGWMWLVVVLA